MTYQHNLAVILRISQSWSIICVWKALEFVDLSKRQTYLAWCLFHDQQTSVSVISSQQAHAMMWHCKHCWTRWYALQGDDLHAPNIGRDEGHTLVNKLHCIIILMTKTNEFFCRVHKTTQTFLFRVVPSIALVNKQAWHIPADSVFATPFHLNVLQDNLLWHT